MRALSFGPLDCGPRPTKRIESKIENSEEGGWEGGREGGKKKKMVALKSAESAFVTPSEFELVLFPAFFLG